MAPTACRITSDGREGMAPPRYAFHSHSQAPHVKHTATLHVGCRQASDVRSDGQAGSRSFVKLAPQGQRWQSSQKGASRQQGKPTHT